MTDKGRALILGWLATHKGDAEGLARWMRDRARIGSLRDCRDLIAAAVEGK